MNFLKFFKYLKRHIYGPVKDILGSFFRTELQSKKLHYRKKAPSLTFNRVLQKTLPYFVEHLQDIEKKLKLNFQLFMLLVRVASQDLLGFT